MKFSLFFELQVSAPLGHLDTAGLATRGAELAASEQRVFRAAVDQAVLADELGYHAVWAVEHHGLVEYSHSSAPEVFLAFVAAKTQRIRLGHGVVLLPARYNHPIRVAERVATLDILSEGRVLCGTGKSASPTEQIAFGIEREELDAEFEEALRVIPQLWQPGTFEHSGKYLQIGPIEVVPKPVQKPHPPLFMACTRTESALRAGAFGIGALNFSFGSLAEIAETARGYRLALAGAVPVGLATTRHFACAPAALVLKDDQRACEHGFRGARFFSDGLQAYYVDWQPGPAGSRLRRDELTRQSVQQQMRLRGTVNDASNMLCGDPAFARERVAAYEAAGVDELLLVMQMGTIPDQVVLESVRVFGEEVIPYFS